MITQDFGQIFPENFIQAMKDMWDALESNSFKKKEPISALLMDGIFPSQDEEDALITFTDGILFIESRDDANNYIAVNSKELWQIIAFALDNGLELPQNEDEKE